jgi:hypothetical protein
MFSTFSTRYKQLPRAGRWGVWLVAVLIAYFAAIEPAVDWSARKATEAERLEKSLAARTRLGSETSASDTLQRSIVAFGGPKPPRSGISDPGGLLSQKTSDLATKHGVTVKSRTRRDSTSVTGLDWNGSKVDRYALELVFECDTEKFLALLKDLEASPDITDISAVRMTKLAEPGASSLAESTVMQVTIVPEMWVIKGSDSKVAEPAPAAPSGELEGVKQ